MKKFFSILLALSIVFILIGQVSAAGYLQMNAPEIMPDETIQDFQTAITRLENHVIRQSDGTFLLRAPPIVTQQILKPIMDDITAGMLIVNQIILRDNLVTTDDLTIFSSKSYLNMLPAVLTDGGVDKLVLRWYGWDLYLSHTTILAIDNLGIPNMFVIVAIIGLAIPGIGPYAALVGAVVYAMWGVIKQIDQGYGVILHFTPTFQLLWISRQ